MITQQLAIGFFAFIAVTLGTVVLIWSVIDTSSPEQKQALRRLRQLGNPGSRESADDLRRGLFRTAISKLNALVAGNNSKGTGRLRSKLALAGYTKPIATNYFRGTQFVLAVVLAIVGETAATAIGISWLKAAVWAVAGGTIGFLIPPWILASKIKQRQQLLRNALPDALDIMVLCSEGGASLNAAIHWVTEEIEDVHPVLGSEMHQIQQEIQLGLSAGDAFRGFADRCEIPEARDLAATLLQSEKYGASVAKSLRTFADAARQDRQVWAEEMAHKAAVKIMFPMLICIFPAMFIVLLGPAAFQMGKLFTR